MVEKSRFLFNGKRDFCVSSFVFWTTRKNMIFLKICVDKRRPEIAALRIEEGHWEGDAVVGKRAGKEAVVLSLLEKKTENYIAIRIPGKDADSVLNAMQSLREEFGDKFSQVFKTIKVVMVSDTLILVIVCFFYGFAHHIFSKEVAFIICCAISESINSTTHKWGC